MGRRGAGMWLAALASACSDARHIEPPDDVDRVALARHDGLTWVDGTPLLPRAPTAHRAALDPSAPTLVMGWSDDALGGLPKLALLANDAVRTPGACEAALPAPSWAVEVEDGATARVDPAALPPLTTDWAAERCPDLEVSTVVVCGDTAIACPVRRVDRVGCRYTFAFECELGPVVMDLARGAACVETPGCAVRVTGPGRYAVSCDPTCTLGDPSCDARFGARPASCTADLEIGATLDVVAEHHALADVAPQTPPTGPDGELRPEAVAAGYLGTPVVLDGDRLVVPVHGWREAGQCATGDATRLAQISTSPTAAATATVTFTDGPPCLDRLVRAPRGPGFYGAYRVGASVAVGRFDAHGVQTQEVVFDALPPVRRRIALLAEGDGPVMLVYTQQGDPQSVIAALDPVTLAVRAQRIEPQTVASAAVLLDGARIAVVDDFSDLIVWYDLDLTTCLGSSQAHVTLYPLTDLGNTPVLSMLYQPAERQLLVALNEHPAIHRIDELCRAPDGEACFSPEGRCTAGQRALPVDVGAEPLTMVPWPARAAIAVASTVRPVADEWRFEAALVLYDQRRAAFRPGVARLGLGIARDAVVDRSGALWLTLPWSAELVRVRATDAR